LCFFFSLTFLCLFSFPLCVFFFSLTFLCLFSFPLCVFSSLSHSFAYFRFLTSPCLVDTLSPHLFAESYPVLSCVHELSAISLLPPCYAAHYCSHIYGWKMALLVLSNRRFVPLR
jgi:hypothetical protein